MFSALGLIFKTVRGALVYLMLGLITLLLLIDVPQRRALFRNVLNRGADKIEQFVDYLRKPADDQPSLIVSTRKERQNDND